MTALRRLYARPPKVFICYRREDTRAEAGRLYDALRARWGARYVRRDLSDIPAGVDFNQAALDQIAASDFLLVMIGPRWHPERLADPTNFVRQEIEKALEKKVRVVPVLVDDASIPEADALPPSLQPLRGQNASHLSYRRWDYDLQVLARHLEHRSWLWAWLVAFLLALVAAYALRGPITRFTQAGNQPIPPSDSTSRPIRTPPSPLVIGDTAATGRLDEDSASTVETNRRPKRNPTDSVSAPAPGPPPTSPPPPPPSPTVEPRPQAVPAPTTGSVVEHLRSQISADQFRSYELTITDSRPCRLRGRVETIEGGSRDIDVLVLDEDNIKRFPHSRYTPVFTERRTREISLDVPLPGPGRYYFVVSNYFSAFQGKLVLVENVRWECAGGESDPTP